MTEHTLGVIKAQKFINKYKGQEIVEGYDWLRPEVTLQIQEDQQANSNYITYVGWHSYIFQFFKGLINIFYIINNTERYTENVVCQCHWQSFLET